jgi:hypothetical protein
MTLAQIMAAMRECWPFDRKIDRVLEGYRVLGRQHSLTLADIALRNGVFASPPDGSDATALARAAGRRDAALEIFTLAQVNPAALSAFFETKSPQRSQS